MFISSDSRIVWILDLDTWTRWGMISLKKGVSFFADDMLISPVQKQETITSVLLVVLKCVLALSVLTAMLTFLED